MERTTTSDNKGYVAYPEGSNAENRSAKLLSKTWNKWM